ncbi:MAG: hypothetical protein ACOZBH_01775 [Patescibacteria group bacterium]
MAFSIGKNNNDASDSKPESSPMPNRAEPTSPEEQRLQFGLWWLEHKQTLLVVAVLTAMAVGGALLIFGLYGLADYYLLGYTKNQRLFSLRTVNLNWDYIRQVSTPGALSFDAVKVIKAGENYDLVVRVTNPNQDWYVQKLDYHFSFGSSQAASTSSYVLPGESMYLVELNQKRAGALTAELVIDAIEWKKQSNFNILKEQLLNFEVSDVNYIPAGQIESGQQPMNQVKFTVKNSSPQNFWNVDFVILLYGGDQLRAVNIYTLDSLDSLEQTAVMINWPGALPAISRAVVIPQIDILNPDSFKGFGEVNAEEK